MDAFLTYSSYFINGIVLLLAISFFIFGIKMIFEVKEITIGKASSQVLAVILAATAFYRIDSIPYLENIIPQITIENSWVEWGLKTLFSILFIYLIYTLYENRREEIDMIKDDTNIIVIMVLFSVSSMCFGYIA